MMLDCCTVGIRRNQNNIINENIFFSNDANGTYTRPIWIVVVVIAIVAGFHIRSNHDSKTSYHWPPVACVCVYDVYKCLN